MGIYTQAMTWWLFLTLAAVSVFDIYAIVFVGGNATVSYEIYRLGKAWPTFYLAIGLLVGHIIFPLHVYHSEGPPAIERLKNGK